MSLEKRWKVLQIALIAYVMLSYPLVYVMMSTNTGLWHPTRWDRDYTTKRGETEHRGFMLVFSPVVLPMNLVYIVADTTMPEQWEEE